MQEWLCSAQRCQWWIAYQTFHIRLFFYSKNPLLDAQVATPCGHSFCEWCVNKIKSKYAGRVIKCESCRDPVSGWCKNLLANNFLSMVDGECKWCSKKVKLNNAKDHIEYCEEMESPCKQCKAMVRRREEDAHSANCSMADVLCPCGLTFKRADEESHIQTTCGLKEVPCPFNCARDVKRLVKRIWCAFFRQEILQQFAVRDRSFITAKEGEGWGGAVVFKKTFCVWKLNPPKYFHINIRPPFVILILKM